MRTVALLVGLCACDKLFLGDPHPGPPSHRATIAAGFAHTCRLLDNGTLSCWGDNALGQIGTSPELREVLVPTSIGAQTWRALAAGESHTCAIDEQRAVWRSVASGDEHACAVDNNGRLHCWGNNASGQVGSGSVDRRVDPTQLEGFFDQVSTGATHTCAVFIGSSNVDDRMHCWGDNTRGQLGDGTRVQRGVPTAVAGDKRWLHVSAGDGTTCGIEVGSDQALYCWGSNLLGQLGDGRAWRTQFAKLP